MWRPSVWALLGVMALSDGLLGCDLGCDKESGDKAPTLYSLRPPQSGGAIAPTAPGGRVNVDRTIYETNDWNEPFVEFPAGRKLLIEHGLGTEPEIFTWLAFVKEPLKRGLDGEDDKEGNAAESAGNMVIIQKLNDQFVQVRNDTCQDFWLRLVAISSGDFESASGQGGADGAEGAGGSE